MAVPKTGRINFPDFLSLLPEEHLPMLMVDGDGRMKKEGNRRK